jgi:type I restriction enzyme S subunit
MKMSREGYKMTELGEIPQEWIPDTLGNCLSKIVGGGTPSRDNEQFYQGEIPWATVKDLDNKFYKDDTIEHITLDAINNSASNLIPIGKIIVATRMGLGRGFINTAEMAINQDLKALFPKDNIDTRYLLHWFLNQAKNIESMGKGSTVKGIRLEELRALPIAIPTFTEQQKISDILSTVDQQIEQTDALIEKTKELKKGLMQRLLTKGIGHTEFRDTEIGQIPKGWEVKKLEEIVQICYGKNQKEVETEDGIYKILGTGGVIGNTNNYLWDKPSVLIGRKGTIDKPMYIEEPFWTVDTLFYTKVNEGYVAKWLYYYLNKIDLKKYNEATGVPSLSVAVLNTILVLVPPFKEQQKISKILSAVDSDIDIYESKKNKLENAKKALMNHLLTGKIRVLVQ